MRTIAHMTFIMPDGRELPYAYDFGHDYPEDSARFMFTDGNYSCDCNRSLFLAKFYEGVEEMDCGDTIQMRDFKVMRE